MKLKVCVGILIALLAFLFYFLYNVFGYFKNDVYVSMERCKRLETPYGPKDFELYGDYVISGYCDRLRHINAGGILSVTTEGLLSLLPLENYPQTQAFNPNGLHIAANSLYVINVENNTKHDYIEAFDIHKENNGLRLTHNKTIRFSKPYYRQLNDVYFINSTLFYATVTRVFPGIEPVSFLKGFRQFIRKSTVLVMCVVTDNVANCIRQDYGNMLNGIAGRGKELFVVDSGASAVHRYFMYHNYTLRKIEEIPLEISGDNIIYNERDGKFYISVLRLKDLFSSREALLQKLLPTIPGGVVELFYDKGKWTNRILFMQKELTGLSAALKVNNTMLLGSWIDNHIFICPIRKPDLH